MAQMNKAREYYLQGAMSHKLMTHGNNRRARRMFAEAIREDGEFARAYGFLSYATLIAYLHDWKEEGVPQDDGVTLDEIVRNARLARDKGKKDYDNWWSWAAANVFASNYDVALPAYTEALRLADEQAIPANLSTLRVEKADALMFQGTERGVLDAIAIVEEEIKTPDFRKTHLWTLGWANFELGFYRKSDEKEYAARSLAALLQFRKPDALIKKNIIANYVILGWSDAASQMAKQLAAELPPGYTVAKENKWPYGDEKDARLGRFKSLLIKAGLPR
jgi:hypothetical protein